MIMPTPVPTRIVGPIYLQNNGSLDKLAVPLATFETPLWFSVNRGARVTRLAGGLQVVVAGECMTRSVLLEAPDAATAWQIVQQLESHRSELMTVVSGISRFTRLQTWHSEVVANLIFLRFSFNTREAAGHNMATKGSEALQQWILKRYPSLRYLSVSGNYCVDKKNSAINGILGRGKRVIAEMVIPRELCQRILRTTPEKIVELNLKKNLIGSIIAGGVRSANAHFANMLLACYLAFGQDAANIVEGSQGLTHAEVRDEGLYFSVTLPNIIVGSVGVGKNLNWVKERFSVLRSGAGFSHFSDAQLLAVAVASVVWCGELSLLAAQTNPGELMEAHLTIERANSSKI